MGKQCSVFCVLIFAVALTSCSIEINPSSTNNPQHAKGPAWKNLNLTGRLVYNIALIEAEEISTSIQSLDLVTGEVNTLFQAPKGSWVDAVAVAPDAPVLIMSYRPPDSTSGQTVLYSMSPNASQPPQPLFLPPTNKDQYTQPYWSPDGKYIYFAHVNYEISFTYDIMQMAYPNGQPEPLIKDAYWPRPSADGTRLVYVALDPESGANSLFISSADGTNAQQVPVTGLPVPTVIDAPMFSADNQTILFSSPLGISASTPNLLDKLMGVIIASADGTIPSEWWTVPVSGGNATQLTKIRALGLYGSFSPDNKYIASYSADRIFVMKPDGSEITVIVNDMGQISGTVNWIR